VINVGEATSPEVGARGLVLAVPIGSCEQHGPHLPLDTDTRIALHLAQALADRRPGVVVGPALAYGASGEHAGFPGTLSIGHEALEAVLVELGRSADHFLAMVFVNGHGGNAVALGRAVTRLVSEGRKVLAWSPRLVGADAHAGRTETSMLLAIAPDHVRLAEAVPGDTRPLRELLAGLTASGVRAVSPSGVLGDPTGATAAEGVALLERCLNDLDGAVTDWL